MAEERIGHGGGTKPYLAMVTSPADMARMVALANQSDRRRYMAVCPTTQPDAPVQVMFNVLNRHSYIRPHRQLFPPNHRSRYLVLSGAAVVVIFDRTGEVVWAERVMSVGSSGASETTPFVSDIPGELFHTVVPLCDGTVVYSVKSGPYSGSPETDKEWPEWAPDEKDASVATAYLDRLLDALKGVIESGDAFRSDPNISTIDRFPE
ncbi:unnamed protein product (mitochondrion) [Plasmodiophora brassicae]|uniref:Cupin fold metalloprotein WbuC cupin domain-containing protein n=2 Tax=Plasmodiophora brassicae TaxID=37360 RepID=A0A3P3YAG9_PLABS|nr:unnamed protein product [Plasmodiophora brassicae]